MKALLTACLLLMLGVVASRADGALAVGSTGDVVKFGVAVGMALDVPADQAASVALANCRSFEAKEPAKYCKVVWTFSRECYAVAYDPMPGTPGIGWAVAKTQEVADERALAACQTTAGANRQQFCTVEARGCDTEN